MLKKIADWPHLGLSVRISVIGLATAFLGWAFWKHGQPSHFLALGISISALVFVTWVIWPELVLDLKRQLAERWHSNWKQFFSRGLTWTLAGIAIFVATPRQYTLVVGMMTGLVYVFWAWRQANPKVKPTECPCGGNVTPLANHGPCGCQLPRQQ